MAFTFAPHSMQRHTVSKEGRRAYIVRYLAVTNLPEVEGPVACRLAYDAQIPIGTGFTYYGDSDTNATRTRAFDVIPWRRGGKGRADSFWVDATFDTGDATNCSTESFEGAPWTHPWSRSKVNTRVMQPVKEDKNGAPLVKVNDYPYDPPIETEYIEANLELTGNLQTLDVNGWAQYEMNGGAINSNTIGSFGAGTLRVTGLTWNEAFYGVCTAYFQARCTFSINPDAHVLKIPQAGYMIKLGANLYAESGTDEPAPLDVNGNEAASTGLAQHVKTEEILKEMTFPPPGIPSSLFQF